MDRFSGLPKLSDRQLDVLAAIKTHIATHKQAPTISEIAGACNCSKVRVRQHLAELVTRRRIAIRPNVHRGIEVIEGR